MKKENIWSVEKNNKKIEGKGGGEKERRREGKKIFEAGKYFWRRKRTGKEKEEKLWRRDKFSQGRRGKIFEE